MASTLGVVTSAILVSIPRSLNEAKVATREMWRGILKVFTFIPEFSAHEDDKYSRNDVS